MDWNEIVAQDGVLVLFGGAHCNVCHAIKPKLEEMVTQQFPKMGFAYIDCEAHTDLCAQRGVFSLPVVQAYFMGQKSGEWVRAFSLGEIAEALQRPYAMVFEEA